MNRYDLIVIGAGPGGITVARFTKSLRKEWDVLIVRKQKKSVIPCALPYAIDGTIKVDDYIKNDEKLLLQHNQILHLQKVNFLLSLLLL